MGEVLRIEEYKRAEKPREGADMAAQTQSEESTDPPIYYGTKEVAEYLNCSIPKAREIMNRKDFPVLKDGRIIRVYKAALEKWSMERRT